MLKRITISNKLGLHARAASKLVQLTNKFSSEITISRGNLRANGKSILGILSLVASVNSEIDIQAIGLDEKKAIKEIERVSKKNSFITVDAYSNKKENSYNKKRIPYNYYKR